MSCHYLSVLFTEKGILQFKIAVTVSNYVIEIHS